MLVSLCYDGLDYAANSSFQKWFNTTWNWLHYGRLDDLRNNLMHAKFWPKNNVAKRCNTVSFVMCLYLDAPTTTSILKCSQSGRNRVQSDSRRTGRASTAFPIHILVMPIQWSQIYILIEVIERSQERVPYRWNRVDVCECSSQCEISSLILNVYVTSSCCQRNTPMCEPSEHDQTIRRKIYESTFSLSSAPYNPSCLVPPLQVHLYGRPNEQDATLHCLLSTKLSMTMLAITRLTRAQMRSTTFMSKRKGLNEAARLRAARSLKGAYLTIFHQSQVEDLAAQGKS